MPDEGNLQAQAVMQQLFEPRTSFEWRGLGPIANSALKLRDEFAAFDAERLFELTINESSDHKACECAAILCGQKQPRECKVFATLCTPETPLGACMVSSEGACAAYYTYGRHQL